MFTIKKTFTFEAAHFLPLVPSNHKCRNMHGHSYEVTLIVKGPIDEDRGWVCDFAVLSAEGEKIRKQLDHRCLNEIEGLENPTSELLARWIFLRSKAQLSSVIVSETRTSSAEYHAHK